MNKNLRQQRAIENVIIKWGYELSKNKFIISIWELAYHLNNHWASELFISRTYQANRYENQVSWAIETYNLHLFRVPLLNHSKKNKNMKIISKDPSWFEIKIKEKQ